jgi:hypothetical protein
VLAATLCLLVGAALQQEPGMLDVPVYRDEAFGVALPRPFPDWVFSPGGSRGTTTVLFHPRDAPLREQLWGALVLAPFGGPVPLAEIAERRVRETWRPMLGRTFSLLTRDSLAVAGLPAIHVVMGGAVDRIAVDVEEYYVARGTDLIIVQFRYPRGLPRDSIAEGYQRAFDGLTVRAPPGGETPTPALAAAQPTPPGLEDEASASRALAGSPWRPRAFDTVVRFDPATARVEFSVRAEVVNDDVQPRDSLGFALRWPLLLDSVRSAAGLPLGEGAESAVTWVRLPQAVAPQEAASVTIGFHSPAAASLLPAVGASAEGAHVLEDWLPQVEAWADSTGAPLEAGRARYTVRFDLPPAFTAVSTGRLAADFLSEGRRRTTWVADQEPAPVPAFVIGRFRRGPTRTGPLVTLRSWVAEADSPGAPDRAGAMADAVMETWRFFTATFGRLAVEAVYLVVSELASPATAGATLLLRPDAPDDSVRAAVARVWWGSTVRFAGPGASWLADALPAWSVLLFHAATDGDSTRQRLVGEAQASNAPMAALEAYRQSVGDAAFRTALRRFFMEHRTAPATSAELLALLGQEH